MIAGWLAASAHSASGGANGILATARAAARTGADGTGSGASPSACATSSAVRTPSPVML
jgi:hypothetical protein